MLKLDSGMPGPFGAGKVVSPATGADALVLFGGTGDLARKKIYPALLAMARRGHLDIPVIAVARAPGDASTLRTLVHDSLQQQGLLDDAAYRKTRSLARLRPGRLRRCRDLRQAASCARPARASALLSGDSSRRVSGRRRRARPDGWHRAGARRHRKAVRTRPRVRAVAEPDAASGISRADDFSHRSLPGQGGDPEPLLFPLRQRVSRTGLESQLRGERADHDGRAVRRRRPWRILRVGRCIARCRAESPAAGDGAAGDGAAVQSARRCTARRKGEASPRRAPARRERYRARAISRLPGRGGRRAEFAGRDLSPRCACTSIPGAGPACRS